MRASESSVSVTVFDMSKRDEEAAADGGSGDVSATVSEDSGDAITDMCVLLVEDDTVARKCAEAALRSCGYRVIAAQNGREALDILKSKEAEKIDMILTDILMPEVSGLQVRRPSEQIHTHT